MKRWLLVSVLVTLSGCGILSRESGDAEATPDTTEEQAPQEQAEQEMEITPAMILKEKEAEPGAGAPTDRPSKDDEDSEARD